MTTPRHPGADHPVQPCWDGRVAGRYLHDGYIVVWAHGEIDMATAPELMKEVGEAVRARPGRVIVDLTQVTFMDSTGLNALVRAKHRADGEVRLVGPCEMVRKVLRLTGLEEVFPVHSTIEESVGPRPTAQHDGSAVHPPAHGESTD